MKKYQFYAKKNPLKEDVFFLYNGHNYQLWIKLMKALAVYDFRSYCPKV